MNSTNDFLHPHRVAIYYAPAPASDWWFAGSQWLGRCAATGQALGPPSVQGIAPAEFEQWTAEPRRYGWHATLKAPFRLAQGHDLNGVIASVQRICQGRTPFELSPLQVMRMGSFLGLRPQLPSPTLDGLAADCVRQLQALAAPLGEGDLARRRRADLTAEQDALLQAWGYPWVLNHFRFHLSLTGPLDSVAPEQVQALAEAAATHFHGLPACVIDRVSVFVEPVAGADFKLVDQVRFQP